jgi:ketosteroid isomerase-like protein
MKHFLIACLMVACASCQTESSQIDSSKEAARIQTVMSDQQDAWNRGDVEGFMKGYWASDSLRFIGKRGITYGWQATLDNYKKSYPSKEAMGRLQFTNLTTQLMSDSSAYVIGKWQLFRTSDTLSGHYSLLWKNFNGQWLIVADHTS